MIVSVRRYEYRVSFNKVVCCKIKIPIAFFSTSDSFIFHSLKEREYKKLIKKYLQRSGFFFIEYLLFYLKMYYNIFLFIIILLFGSETNRTNQKPSGPAVLEL